MAKSFFIWTVGCQMNEADSERLGREMAERGLRATNNMEEADVIVLNTCAVRAAAEEKTFGKLGELKELKRRKPDVTIAVGGCMVGADHSDLKRRAPHVSEFFRPIQFESLLERVAPVAAASRNGVALVALTLGADLRIPAVGDGCVVCSDDASSRTKSRPTRWISVINGCNRACTYCIVPSRRGREASRPISEIVAEARQLVSEGAREVTLLGQIVDRYGRDLPGRPDLADLFDALAAIDDLWRIRFLTSHPADMPERVIDAVGTLDKVMENINIPVQSGSDTMLRRMKRGYTIERYLSLIDRIRQRVPGVALATDVIVGMSGETDAEFQTTLDLLERVRFDVVHVAMYSPRPGTTAATWEDDVPREVKRERLHAVESIQERIATEINAPMLGATVEVLVDDRVRGRWQGRTRSNKLVFFDHEENWLGRLARVTIARTSPWSLGGDVVAESAASVASRRGLTLVRT